MEKSGELPLIGPAMMNLAIDTCSGADEVAHPVNSKTDNAIVNFISGFLYFDFYLGKQAKPKKWIGFYVPQVYGRNCKRAMLKRGRSSSID
jgi:hypothetical protein